MIIFLANLETIFFCILSFQILYKLYVICWEMIECYSSIVVFVHGIFRDQVPQRNLIGGARNRGVGDDDRSERPREWRRLSRRNFRLPMTAGIIYGNATNTKNCSSLKSSKWKVCDRRADDVDVNIAVAKWRPDDDDPRESSRDKLPSRTRGRNHPRRWMGSAGRSRDKYKQLHFRERAAT